MKLDCALVIDDDSTTNYINVALLEKSLHCKQIQIAMNGEKALNFINAYSENSEGKSPELIILDLNMPVFDGFQFLEYYSRKKFTNKDDVKIIILSSLLYKEDLEKIAKYPSVKYIIKPLTEGKIKDVLNIG